MSSCSKYYSCRFVVLKCVRVSIQKICVWCASEVVSEGRYQRHCSLILQPPLSTPTPQEYSTGSTSRTVLALYTSAIFVNACSPLFLHLMLLRRTQQGAVAKWIRSYLLFDAVFDSMYVEWGEGPEWAVMASVSSVCVCSY